MKTKHNKVIAACLNAVLICLLVSLRYSGIATFQIGNAVPVVLLPLIISISMFFSDNSAIVAALVAGIFTDSISADSSCFNTVFFVLMAAICNLLCNHYLNRNIKSAGYLSLLTSTIYFFMKYLVFFVFKGITVNYDYFMLYLIPAVVYTAIFIIPFYFLEKKLSKYE